MITLTPEESLALRDAQRAIEDLTADAQIAADKARAVVNEAVVTHRRLVRELADRYGFDATVPYQHDASTRTLTRTGASEAATRA